MRDAFIAELMDMAEHDPSIMLITGDLGFGVLNAYIERFPHQFLNAGVAEQNMTGLAAGLALEGHKVYTYSIRSEEHTSELQSLMRISYAVLCLEKKNNIDHTNMQRHNVTTPV